MYIVIELFVIQLYPEINITHLQNFKNIQSSVFFIVEETIKLANSLLNDRGPCGMRGL